jgi:electron transfer flavoprotein alpha subunit
MSNKHAVIIQHTNQNIDNASLSALSAARELSRTVDVILLAPTLAVYNDLYNKIKSQVANVHYIIDESFTHMLSQPYAAALSTIIIKNNFTHIWAGATSFYRETLPRLTVRIPNAVMVSDVEKVIDENIFERNMWSGDIITKVQTSQDAIKMITVRSANFPYVSDESHNTMTSKEKYEQIVEHTMKFIALDIVKSDRPALTDAPIIVSGGRGLKNPESFKSLIYPLADAMNAAIGASRAICDANWVPNDWQVGQTGKIVAPSIYFAIGLSGAIQHVAGLRGAKTVIAINNDKDAPIFQVADYGIVDDAFQVVPELTNKIKELL